MLAFAAMLVVTARGQNFTNLDFELAYNLPGNPPEPDGSTISVTNALPDWTAYVGSTALSYINYVSNFFGGASSPVELEGGSLALSGNFSVGFYAPLSSISQTGMVPENAESLQFESTGYSPNLQVTLGGQELSYSAVSEGPDYTVYGANIPADLDGQLEELTFGASPGAGTKFLLDDIEFMTVPEPSECALMGLSAILFGLWHRRKQQR